MATRMNTQGKIWAREVSADEVLAQFPAGQFIASWGSAMVIEAGDFLAMPFPSAGEIYRIARSAFMETYRMHALTGYIPSQAEALAHWEGRLRADGTVYAKNTKIYAKLATEGGFFFF